MDEIKCSYCRSLEIQNLTPTKSTLDMHVKQGKIPISSRLHIAFLRVCGIRKVDFYDDFCAYVAKQRIHCCVTNMGKGFTNSIARLPREAITNFLSL